MERDAVFGEPLFGEPLFGEIESQFLRRVVLGVSGPYAVLGVYVTTQANFSWYAGSVVLGVREG